MAREQSGVVAALWRQPVKSMLGEQLAEVEISRRGVVGDRAYALREVATGRIVSAKKFARMYDFRSAYEKPPAADHVTPVAITLPDGHVIHAEDSNAADVIGEFLGRRGKLERSEKAAKENAGIDPKTIFGDVPPDPVIPGLQADKMPPHFPLAAGTFFDTAIMHVIASGTLRHMAKIAQRSIFDPRRFRPTIYVDSGLGDDRFIEDDWVGGTLEVGASVKIVEM